MNIEETIYLGGGCFWCTEALFQQLKGVEEVESGYMGGEVKNPTYEQVCSGNTGHAEVIKVTYNSEIISLHDILTIFFTLHDPTTLNRQGTDTGTQYRSVIFYTMPEQKTVAEKVIEEIEAKGIWDDSLVTELQEASEFYPAEEYHQNYYKENAGSMYCRIVIEPKVAKLRKEFTDKLI